MAVKTPNITATAQPAVITIQSEFSASDFEEDTGDHRVAKQNRNESVHELAEPGNVHTDIFITEILSDLRYLDSSFHFRTKLPLELNFV